MAQFKTSSFRLFTLLAGIALPVLIAPVAQAMDLPPEVQAPEIAMRGTAHGWYLRGDFGYAGWTANGGINVRSVVAGPVYTSDSFDTSRFGEPVSYGVGAGYQFNDTFRADLSASFYDTDFKGAFSDATPCDASLVGTGCSYGTSANYSGQEFMANVYADLGTVVGLTPYVGAGAGMTELTWGTATVTPSCTGGACPAIPPALTASTYGGTTSWRFGWALMAGVSYEVTPHVLLDLGYRYNHLSGGDMFNYAASEQALGATGAKGSDGGFDRHEVRAGIRITTW